MYNPTYPGYYAMNYNQQLYNNQMQNQQPQQSNSLTWVQGEAAAKSFPMVAGQSVLLMDSEESVFYIKSTDQSGMPQPLRIFDYKERTSERSTPAAAKNTNDDFVSRKEFEEFREDVKRTIKGLRKEEGEG